MYFSSILSFLNRRYLIFLCGGVRRLSFTGKFKKAGLNKGFLTLYYLKFRRLIPLKKLVWLLRNVDSAVTLSRASRYAFGKILN